LHRQVARERAVACGDQEDRDRHTRSEQAERDPGRRAVAAVHHRDRDHRTDRLDDQRQPLEPVEGRKKATAFAKGGFSCQIGIMTAPNDRRGSNDRRVLDRRVTIRGDRPVAERRTNGERRTGLERRLAILSAEGQIREALRLLTEVIDRGAARDDEQRSLESALVRLRYALDRLEEEE
jgi:hypothetical protein